jgi:hypothetical protein
MEVAMGFFCKVLIWCFGACVVAFRVQAQEEAEQRTGICDAQDRLDQCIAVLEPIKEVDA